MAEAELKSCYAKTISIDAIDRNGCHILTKLLFYVHYSQIVIVKSMKIAEGEQVLR